MILPIVGYGSPVLRQEAQEIDQNYPELPQLIADMYETMHSADGIGLAAPQIGRSIALFVIDFDAFREDQPEIADFKKAFINPIIVGEEGELEPYNEGCLSVPDVHEDVMRPPIITLEYYDENWQLHETRFVGLAARVIQHEYDHLEGIIFTDHVSSFKKRMLKGKLNSITKGAVSARYKMRFGVKDLETSQSAT
ncbi:MAG: hypothetical protein RIS47_828 [Bacteroidota bacterium]|jgi:peptide deformylase